MRRNILVLLSCLVAIHGLVGAQPSRKEFEELIKDEGKLDFLICTSAISFYSSDKDNMMRIQGLVKESNIDEVKREPSKVRNRCD